MKYFVLTLVFIALVFSACEREVAEKQRYITSSIVGNWWTMTSTDSITHEYTNYGKLTVNKYSGGILRYVGEFDFDIHDDMTMEYWGERLDDLTPFTIYSNDTLVLSKFNGRNYTLFRIIE